VTTPTQIPERPAAPGGPGGKLAAAAGGRRNLLIAAAAGTALVAFLMARSGGGGGGGSVQQMDGYDSTPYDQYNELQNQLETIQRQIDEGKVVPGAATPPTTTPKSPKPAWGPLPWRPPSPRPIPRPSKPVKPGPSKNWYVIRKGDTLSEIAARKGISMSTLRRLNPNFWSNPKYDHGNRIWAGGKVRVK
jgi:nucleoid-associated protein YgaU